MLISAEIGGLLKRWIGIEIEGRWDAAVFVGSEDRSILTVFISTVSQISVLPGDDC
jgi:hypothetical protein